MREILVARIEGAVLRVALIRVRGQEAAVADSEEIPGGGRSRFAGREAVLLLDDDDRSMRHFVLPPLSGQNLRRMAVLQAEQRLPPADGGYVFDMLARKTGDAQCVLVVGLPRKRLEPKAARLKEAGLDLSGLAVEPLVYAALAPGTGAALLRLPSPKGEICLACRDGLPAGWGRAGPEALVEEFFVKSPRAFEADVTPDSPAGADPTHVPFLAAALYAAYPHRLKYEGFLRQEEQAPASRRQVLVCAAAWALALALGLAAAWGYVRQMEGKRKSLQEIRDQKRQFERLSKNVVQECGRLTPLTLQLRKRSEGKVLATTTLRRLSEVLPAGVRLTALSFSDRGQITLDCEASDPQTPILFLDLLRNTPGVREPVLEYYSDRGQDRMTFRVSCGARAEEAKEAPAAPRRQGGETGRAEE